MKRISSLVVSLFLMEILNSPVLAAEKTVTLKVDGMTCQSCPYMVKTAVKKLKGITKIEVSLATKKAVVIFDDSLTNVEEITHATFNAGFPSEEDDGTANKVKTDKKAPVHRGSF